MKITEALKSLENSWSREDVLVKIQKGDDSEKIINDFLNTNQSEIEDLSNIESKLINKIKNYSSNKVDSSKKEIVQKQIPQPEKEISFDLGFFMMKWSNKFVFISLLVISAIALTKQAWA